MPTGFKREKKIMAKKNKNVEDDELDAVVNEVIESEDPEIETTETTEPETVEPETEPVEQETEPETTTNDEPEQESEPETEQESEPEKPNNAEKKKADEDTDAELDAFFEKLRKNKEKQMKAANKEKGTEKTFTQAEFEKALKSALAKRLPSKEEREQFEKWREGQQTLEEKMSVLRVKNNKLEETIEKLKRDNFEVVEKLKHENTIIKAGVDRDAVEFVQYKVEQMDGDFDENLQSYLKEHKRYITPKTTIVEAAEHKPKAKTGITKADLDKMGYAERANYRNEHPEEYARAMGR